MRRSLFGSIVLLCVATLLVMAAAVGADTGAPTNPADTTTTAPITTPTVTTTATTPQAPPAPPVPPWMNPKNLTFNWIVKVGRGPVCAKGDTSGNSCHYVPFPGTVLQVYASNGKLVRTYTSGKSGLVTVKLPKGHVRVRFSHPPVAGVHYLPKSFNVTAPLFHVPGNKFDFAFSY